MSDERTNKGKQKLMTEPEAVQLIRLVEVLKKYTDEEHPFETRSELEEIIKKEGLDELYLYLFGGPERKYKDNKKTKRLLKLAAVALNCDRYGDPLPEAGWEIVYDELIELYGDGASDDDEDDELTEEEEQRLKSGTQLKNVYYKHPFTTEEVDAIIESIRENKLLLELKKQPLIDKIKEKLTSKYYTEKLDDKGIWIEDKITHLPEVLQEEYRQLKISVMRKDVCGSLLRLKDIYEISMKIPAIFALISLDAHFKPEEIFKEKTDEELAKEKETAALHTESEEETKYKELLRALLKEPLAIGSWYDLIGKMVAKKKGTQDYVFGGIIDENLLKILELTRKLMQTKPRKANSDEQYSDIANWRNQTIGHGTIQLDTEGYKGQVLDLINGINATFEKMNLYYGKIMVDDEKLTIGDKSYSFADYEYIYKEGKFFFDSYYSRNNCTEITDYFYAKERLPENEHPYYQMLFHNVGEEKAKIVQDEWDWSMGDDEEESMIDGGLITDSKERELFAELNGISDYVKPQYIYDKISEFITVHKKGVYYIQMERGMGKSTLSYELDGRYQKDIFQKGIKDMDDQDVNVVVRGYHISDMQLRINDKTEDYFTALETNLKAFDSDFLEMPDKLFKGEIDLLEIKQRMRGENKEAAEAFLQFLEVYRRRYIKECEGKKIKLVYFIDGIDELNDDTQSILNTVPGKDQPIKIRGKEIENVYVILLSRLEGEESLPDIAKECVKEAEEKAGEDNILRIDGVNEDYNKLLKQYILKNKYKTVSEEEADKIIELAQHKFLYIQPYLALGEKVLEKDGKLTPKDVAANYIKELEKHYFGVSLHTLQLIIASVAVFHSISLKEICELVLFTPLSYDAFGVMRDILPLIAIRRTDGDDVYEFANVEYEEYVLNDENYKKAACEVIRRFRISVVSWFGTQVEYREEMDRYGEKQVRTIDKRGETYSEEWAYYVGKLLHVDGVAEEIGFEETSEGYIKCLISMKGSFEPHSFYPWSVSGVLDRDEVIHLLHFLKQQKQKEPEMLTIIDLNFVRLEYRKVSELDELGKLRAEYTETVIAHCKESQKVDFWFKLIISNIRMPLVQEPDSFEEDGIMAVRTIVEHWEHPDEVVNYLYGKAKDEFENGIYVYWCVGILLEEMLSVKKCSKKEKIYEGLLYAYALLANKMIGSVEMTIAPERKRTMERHLNEASVYKELENYELIDEIRAVFSGEWVTKEIDRIISRIESISGDLDKLTPWEFNEIISCSDISKYFEDKDVEQRQRYFDAVKMQFRNILSYLRGQFDGRNVNIISNWLRSFFVIDTFSYCFTIDDRDIVEGFLDLYKDVVTIYAANNNAKAIGDLEYFYYGCLEWYDKNIREEGIGLYSNNHEKYDYGQRMTEWEKTFAIYCSMRWYFRFDLDDIQIIANEFTNKYLQELYDANEYEAYYELNEKIKAGYEMLDFVGSEVGEEAAINYYRWLCSRYYRSLEGKDAQSTNELFRSLIEEYNRLLRKTKDVLENENSLLNKESGYSEAERIVVILLHLSTMVPDEISTIEKTKEFLFEKLEDLKKKSTHKEEIKRLVYTLTRRIIHIIRRMDKEFVVKNTGRSVRR